MSPDPITVETLHRPTPLRHQALQYLPATTSVQDALIEFTGGDVTAASPGDSPTLWLLSTSPAKKVAPGDWVVRTPAGAVATMTDEVFRATYREAPEHACVDVRIYLSAGPAGDLGVSPLPSDAKVVGSNVTPETLEALGWHLESTPELARHLFRLVLQALEQA